MMKIGQQEWEIHFGAQRLRHLGLTFQTETPLYNRRILPGVIELTLPQGITLNKILQLAEQTMTVDPQILSELGDRRFDQSRVIAITDADLPNSKGNCSNKPNLENKGSRIPDVIEIAALFL